MQRTAKRVTPAMLGQAKARIDLPKSMTYSHREQAGQGADPIRMLTWNGTQTFDPRGNPRDSDNDK